MRAHNLRTMFSRRNVAPFTLFFLLAVVVVCGFTTSTGQSSAEASVGNGRGDQRPPEFANRNLEDIKKDFNDDDLKVKEQKPRGKWGIVLETDMGQFNDSSVPVAIGTIQSLSGGGEYAGVVKIKRVEIKNRSSKVLNSVQLRWEIVNLDNPAKVLLEGTTPFANFWAEANNSQVIEIAAIYPAVLFKPLAKNDELYGQFQLTIGVQEARFADGSFWRRREAMTGSNAPYFDWSLSKQFPYLASILPDIPPPTEPNNRWSTITPCKSTPRSSASAFYFIRFQTTSCTDDTTTVVDPETGRQSCGAYSAGQACYSECSADGWCTVYRVPGERCSSTTPTQTPTPTPTPLADLCPAPTPAPCCTPVPYTPPLTSIQSCLWNCKPDESECPVGTRFVNGCYSVSGLAVCEDGYDFTNSPTYGPACCPTPTPEPPDRSGDGGGGGGGCDPAAYQACLDVENSRWVEASCSCLIFGSPVLVDVEGDGFDLTGLHDGVSFDLDSDGAPERLAWTAPGADDAWLALDRDGDGVIDDGRELFGDFTPQPEPPPGRGRNGFLALAEFDRPSAGGNSDGLIDARDAVFARLRLWRDANRDGVSQSAELHALASVGVARLHLDYRESKRVDEHGNEFRYRAKVEDAKGSKVSRRAWDVFLVRAP